MTQPAQHEPMHLACVTPNHFFLLGSGWQFGEDYRPTAPIQPKGDMRLPSEPRAQLRDDDDPEAISSLHPHPPPSVQSTDASPAMPKIDFELAKPVLIFDTETAGLGAPAVCQLSYLHLKPGGTIVEYDKVLKLPKGIKMSPEAARIHGITTAMSAAGADPAPELDAFFSLVADVKDQGGVIVAHNASFDTRAINFSAENTGLTQRIQATEVMCTMRASSRHSPLKTSNGRRKPFRLEELYAHHFGGPPTWARLHNSLDDSRVLALCYLEGKRLDWWQ